MKNKYFNINEKGHSVRCKLYFNDLRAIKRVVICLHGFTGHMDRSNGSPIMSLKRTRTSPYSFTTRPATATTLKRSSASRTATPISPS